METLKLNEPYAQVLEQLGDVQKHVDEALYRYAMQQAQQQILDLEGQVQRWEEKYGCSYDLFAYRTAVDETYVHELNTHSETQMWEADLITWEFYATELKAWRQRLNTLTMS
jgi:hypothetical protein